MTTKELLLCPGSGESASAVRASPTNGRQVLCLNCRTWVKTSWGLTIPQHEIPEDTPK